MAFFGLMTAAVLFGFNPPRIVPGMAPIEDGIVASFLTFLEEGRLFLALLGLGMMTGTVLMPKRISFWVEVLYSILYMLAVSLPAMAVVSLDREISPDDPVVISRLYLVRFVLLFVYIWVWHKLIQYAGERQDRQN